MNRKKSRLSPVGPALDRRRFMIEAGKTVAAGALVSCPLGRAFASLPAAPENTPGAKPDLATDPRRPQFHLLPASNWMNDPNGPIYWKGRYHMFFQYNPHAAVWGDMHWYHSVSPDMVHWKHLPVALAPTPGGPDSEGCFSGTCVVHNGVPTFIYTGVQTVPPDKAATEATLRDGHNDFRETQLYATSTDPELRTWTKRAAPVIARPPAGLEITGFRDPAPWKEGDTWYLAVGSGIKGKGGAILLYKSADLENWDYLHFLYSHDTATSTAASGVNNPVDSGDMWECPDFFPLGDKHVLFYSTQGKVLWHTGTFDKQALVFHPEQSGILDHGSFYAPKTQLDKAGNRILWGWIPETRPVAEYSASGWAGLMSLPRVLTLGPDNRLRIAVDTAVEKLRQHEQKLTLSPIKAGAKEMISNTTLKGACGELLCTIKPGGEPFTVDLLSPSNPGDKEATTTQPSFLSIRYSHANPKELIVDTQRLPITLSANEPIEMHFYIDGSVIELIVNNQSAITKRFDYPGPTAPEIAVNFTGKSEDVSRLSLWQLTPISKNRLTT